jgi:hypothetical protein
VKNTGRIEIRGANTGLATKVAIDGAQVGIERSAPNQGDVCALPHCLKAFVTVFPNATLGERVVTLTAVDGRNVFAKVKITAPVTKPGSDGTPVYVCDTSTTTRPAPVITATTSSTGTAEKVCARGGPTVTPATYDGAQSKWSNGVAVSDPQKPTVVQMRQLAGWCYLQPPGSLAEFALRSSDGKSSIPVAVSWGERTLQVPPGQWSIVLGSTTPPGAYTVTAPRAPQSRVMGSVQQ